MNFCFVTKFVSIAACLTLSALALTGCASTMLLSENIDKPGLSYYLPKSLTTITITAYGHNLEKKDKDGKVIKRWAENIFLQIDDVIPDDVADTERSYTLRYEPSSASNDRVCMGVKNGLLETVEAAADDKTGDIIVSVAKLVGRLAGPIGFSGTQKRVQAKVVALRSIKLQIDPLNKSHWGQINHRIQNAFPNIGGRYRFSVEDIQNLLPASDADDACPINAICYRTRVPARFVLKSSGYAISSSYHPIINRAAVRYIDVTRALMVEKVTRLGFNKGVLDTVQIKKPSEGLAVAQLPLTVLDAALTSALSAPGKFVNNFAGLPSNTALKMISDAKSNAIQVKNLQKSLRDIREGDLSDEGAIAKQALTLTCTASGA